MKAAVDDNDTQTAQLLTRLSRLEDQVNLLDVQFANQRTPFLKSGGQNIGVLLDTDLVLVTQNPQYRALSFSGFTFGIDARTGKNGPTSRNIYFASAGCIGDAYVKPYEQMDTTENHGTVFRTPEFLGDTVPAYYMARCGDYHGNAPITVF